MARSLPSGTPARSTRYLFPGRDRRLLFGSVAAGAVVLVGLMTAYFAGARRVVSPGPVAGVHAPIGVDCAQCHSSAAREVADIRCERCHDPLAADRMTNAAHVLLGSSDALKAAAAPEVACVQCHTEHRGVGAVLSGVDDRECAACHQFSTLARHPEFAVTSAGVTTGIGLVFNHRRHVERAIAATGQPCESCHRPTADREGFEPIGFDAHCASCHTKNGFLTGETDPVSPALLLMPEQLGLQRSSPVALTVTPAARGDVQISNVVHRDPWVMTNAIRLRQALEPDAEAAERVALAARLSYLRQQTSGAPPSAMPPEALRAWADALREEIAGIDRSLATPARADDDTRALSGMLDAVRALAGQLPGQDGGAKPVLVGPQDTLPSARRDTDEAAARTARFEARREEIRRALEAIERRGDPGLTARAQQLRQRLDALRPEGDLGQPDTSALQEGLDRLERLFQTVNTIQDPTARAQAAEVAALRDVARQRVGDGLSPEDFEERRQELLSALDAIGRVEDATVQRRVAELRRRVVLLRPGTVGTGDLERLRREKARLLDRLELEIELAGRSGPSGSTPLRDPRAYEREIDELTRELDVRRRVPAATVVVSPDERDERGYALDALLLPCMKCHVLEGARLAPVAAAEPVMPRAIFTHRPHVTQRDCNACHASAVRSDRSEDVNVPGLSNCQECHSPGQARADCAACHVYHPKSLARLGAAR
jgi:hypothetical protein